MQRILVTGATGFVGRALCHELIARKHIVRAAVRRANGENRLPLECEVTAIGAIGAGTDWSIAVERTDVVIHLAARVHVMRETAADPLEAFREVNVVGAERLARAAASSGVKRLVYVSSIKVNGESTVGTPFTEATAPSPLDAYSISKHEAELALRRVAQETGLEVVIVRPPLIYGPSVGGNFLRLLKFVARGVPLPLARVNNQRSMIFLRNFLDALAVCAIHPGAAGKTYLVSDGRDVSTSQLMHDLARLMRMPSLLWPCPTALLWLAGRFIGKSDEIERLLDSLQIDSSQIRRELGWVPPFTMEQGLAETVRCFQGRDV